MEWEEQALIERDRARHDRAAAAPLPGSTGGELDTSPDPAFGNQAFARAIGRQTAPEPFQRAHQAFARVIARHPQGAPATAPAAGGDRADDADWQSTGNLHGPHPFVRDEHRVPSTGVVEDARECGALLEAARGSLRRQQQRAAGMIDRAGNITDYRWFFARVYSHVTENEIRFVEHKAYYYPSYVLRCVLEFEKIYADNFAAFERPDGRPEHHWRRAFEQAQRSQQTVEQARELLMSSRDPDGGAGLAGNYLFQLAWQSVEALTASMKAHIRFDLPRAEAWVFNRHYAAMPGVEQHHFMPDFMSMSGVFDNASREFQPEMAQRLGIPVDLMPQLAQDESMRWLFSADMATERADTWRRAEALGSTAGSGPYRAGAGGAPEGDVVQGADGQGSLAPIEHLADPTLRPSMDAPMSAGDDDSAHSELDHLGDQELARLPAVRRTQHLRALLKGATVGDDETLVLRILRVSRDHAHDMVTVVDGADAWDLVSALDGGNKAQLRELLRQSYYPYTAAETAMRLIVKCLDGETAEWEEEMVADLITVRPDARALVERIGQHYPRQRGASDFERGINKLEWQLDGAEEDAIHAKFGLTGSSTSVLQDLGDLF